MATVADVLAAVDRLAPLGLAESWDNVGLLLGDRAREARRVLVSLDVSERTVDEADRLGADVHLAHHPLLFRPVDRLTADTRAGRLALRCLAASRSSSAATTGPSACRWRRGPSGWPARWPRRSG